MIRQSTVLLASVLSLAVTAAIARDEINKPVQLAQADKGAVVNPAAAAKKQADGADDVLAGRKAAKSIDKPGTIANKGLAVPQVSPAGKGAVAGTQSKSAAPL